MEQRLWDPAGVHLRRRQPSIHGGRAGGPDPHRLRPEPRPRPGARARRTSAAGMAPRAHVRRPAVRAAGRLGGGNNEMTEPYDPMKDPALWRGLTQRRVSRRELFKYAGAGAGALTVSSFLAACGVSGTANKPRPTSSADLSKIYGNGTPAGT